jgi:hypothetical protein
LLGDKAIIQSSTISGNTTSGDNGAGILAGGTVTIANCTISGNQILFNPLAITEGGGIYVFGNLDLNNDTIANNVADKGGGIENLGAITASNTIIADNTASYGYGPDCAGPLTSSSYDLSTTECFIGGTGDVVADPLLGPLTVNPPGLNATQALLTGSPAIGAGAPTIGTISGPGCASNDERGVRRVAGACDIGAYQS